MQTYTKKILLSSVLLLTAQNILAESFPTNYDLAPGWGLTQEPIVWGDCIPVTPIGMHPLDIPMGMPMAQPGMMPAPMGTLPSQQPFLLPPPSPFFNPPFPLNKPLLQANCDSGESAKFEALQAQYNQGTSASIKKIDKLKQALADIQNQMSDGRTIIDNTTKENTVYKAEIAELKDRVNTLKDKSANLQNSLNSKNTVKTFENEQDRNIIDSLKKKFTELENKNKTLVLKLATAEKDAGAQARKLTILNQSAAKLVTLQNSYKARNNANETLKKQLIDLDNANKTLKAQLESEKSNVSSQARKLTALGQSTTALIALQSTYKERNDENSALKKEITDLVKNQDGFQVKLKSLQTASTLKGAQDNEAIKGLTNKLAKSTNDNKTLQAQLTNASNNAGSQARKLTVLGQSVTELTALKSAYKERNDENAAIKEKLADFENNNKTLKTRLATATSNSGNQQRKIAALGQSATELTALQSAYKERNDENVVLKGKLADFISSNKTLKTQLATATSNAGNQQKKLAALGQSANELTVLQSAYKERNDENTALKEKLTDFESNIKTLKTQLATATSDAGVQQKKLTALGQSVTEFTALKSAYKERNDENAALKEKLTVFENNNKTLKTQLETATSDAGAQQKKLTALGQSATEFTALKSAYKERNDENTALNEKLTNFESNIKTLKTQLETATSDAGVQQKKLTALGQSATEFTALKSAYKERNDENAVLKGKITDFESNIKTLKIQLATATSDAGVQQKKLTALGQSATELTALKSAYNERNVVNAALKEKLTVFESNNKTLKTQLATATSNASNQQRKLMALGQSATEFTALKGVYKERNDENAALKLKLTELETSSNTKVAALQKQLSNLEGNNKTLQTKINTLDTKLTNEARKITVLTKSSDELVALKGAYKELASKKEKINAELIKATADTDKDGILDSHDKCPSTISGTIVNALGCFADADDDGVSDAKDKCPSSPVNSQVNETGCPKEKDVDNDGVADTSDLCPNTSPDKAVNEFGCSATENITLKGVNFSLGSARLTSGSLPILDAAAETLNKSPKLNIEIAGHTDNLGDATINQRLSRQRANSVMIHLIKRDVDPARLTAKGYGDKNPIASNDNNAGRATNRRVELIIK